MSKATPAVPAPLLLAFLAAAHCGGRAGQQPQVAPATDGDSCAATAPQQQAEGCDAAVRTADLEAGEAPCRCLCEAGHAVACLNLAALYLQAKQPAQALKVCKPLCDAGNKWGCGNLAAAYGELGRFDEALQITRALCEVDEVYACANGAWYAALAGRGKAAESIAERGLRVTGELAGLYLNLGHALLLQGKLQDSEAAYMRALAIEPAKRATLHSDLAELTQRQPQLADASASMRARFPLAADQKIAPSSVVSIAEIEQLQRDSKAKEQLVMPDERQRGPGVPVDAPQAEKAALAALQAVLSQPPEIAVTHFETNLVLGPALWSIVRRDVPDVGEKATVLVPLADETHRLAARTIRSDGFAQLFASAAFKGALRAVLEGGARAATAGERAALYAMIPFEIAGEPVTIVGSQRWRMVVMMTDDGVAWLDLIGFYLEREQP